MKFWKTLRLVSSALFICLVLLAWLGADGKPVAGGPALHAAPAFTH